MKGRAPRGPSLSRRLAAIVYDALLLVAVMFAATAVWIAFREGEAVEPGSVVYDVFLLGVTLVYFGGFWVHGGRTLGMLVWKLRIRAADGARPTWGHAAVRFSAALLSWACLGLGFCWVLFDREGRTWHGRLSRTRVDTVPAPSVHP